MQIYIQLHKIFVLELEYALKTGKTYKFQNQELFGFFQSCRFIVFFKFLHTHFYVCHIRIFTDIKFVIFPRKWLQKYVCHTYGKYVCLRIPNLKIRIYTNGIRIYRLSGSRAYITV